MDGNPDISTWNQAAELLFWAPEQCSNSSLCNSLAALQAETKRHCAHLSEMDCNSNDIIHDSAMRGIADKYNLEYTLWLLESALGAERLRLTAADSAAQAADNTPAVMTGHDTKVQQLQATQPETAGDMEDPWQDDASAAAGQDRLPDEAAEGHLSAQTQDEVVCAQRHPSLSPPSDSDISIGGTPPPLPQPQVRPDWARAAHRAGTGAPAAAQQVLEMQSAPNTSSDEPWLDREPASDDAGRGAHAQQGQGGSQGRSRDPQASALEEMALIPDTYADMKEVQQLPDQDMHPVAPELIPQSDIPLHEDIENSCRHSNGGGRLPDSPCKPSSQQAKPGTDGAPAAQADTPPGLTQHNSPIWDDSSPMETPFNSPEEMDMDQPAPDQAPQQPPPTEAAGLEDAAGDSPGNEVCEDAAEAAQALLELESQPSPRPASAPAERFPIDRDLRAAEGADSDSGRRLASASRVRSKKTFFPEPEKQQPQLSVPGSKGDAFVPEHRTDISAPGFRVITHSSEEVAPGIEALVSLLLDAIFDVSTARA